MRRMPARPSLQISHSSAPYARTDGRRAPLGEASGTRSSRPGRRHGCRRGTCTSSSAYRQGVKIASWSSVTRASTRAIPAGAKRGSAVRSRPSAAISRSGWRGPTGEPAFVTLRALAGGQSHSADSGVSARCTHGSPRVPRPEGARPPRMDRPAGATAPRRLVETPGRRTPRGRCPTPASGGRAAGSRSARARSEVRAEALMEQPARASASVSSGSAGPLARKLAQALARVVDARHFGPRHGVHGHAERRVVDAVGDARARSAASRSALL